MKKIVAYIVITMLTLMVLFTILGRIDIYRFTNDREPLFIIKKEYVNDGGTTVYYGVGYQLISWKVIDDRDIVDITYLSGKEYHIISFRDVEDGPTIEFEKE